MAANDKEYEQLLDFRLTTITDLPASTVAILKDMPVKAKIAFWDEYNSSKRNVLIAYLLHILPSPFSFTYAYLGKWGKQIAYFMTLGGLGVWWLANLFRIPGLVRKYNTELSDRILKSLLISYAPSKSLERNTPVRRQITTHTDFSNLSVMDLEEGYLFDYDAKTWKVASARQLDWNDGGIEKQLKIVSDLEKAVLFVSIEAEPSVYFTVPLNIHRIDEHIEEQVLNGDRPPQTLTFKGEKFFREYSDAGLAFQREQPIKIKKWVYMDATQTQIIRIEKEERDVAAFAGRAIRPSAILDILPRSI